MVCFMAASSLEKETPTLARVGVPCPAKQAKFASTSVTTPPLTTLQAAPTTCSHFLETKAAADRLHPRPNKGPLQPVSQSVGETYNVVAAV